MSFFSQTFGTQTYNSDPIGAGIVVPGVVSREGGSIATAYANLSIAATYTVLVGGIPAYSGVPGQGNIIRSLDGESITFVIPPLPIGVAAVQITDGVTVWNFSVTVLEKPLLRNVFMVRRNYHKWGETGPRLLDWEPRE